jgi:hypothetical protein
MQERSLSTRMLHFCKNKLYFECRTHAKSEENEHIYTGGLRFAMWQREEKQQDRRPTKPSLQVLDASRAQGLSMKWTKMLSEYSRRRLTNGGDKLVAINSIAQEMLKLLPDLYIHFAGMWKFDLPRQLLWQPGNGSVSMPKEYRAPSWSWASVDGHTSWMSYENTPRQNSLLVSRFDDSFEVLDISEGSEPREGNFLKVQTSLRRIAAIEECSYDDRWVHFNRGSWPYDLFVSTKTSIHSSKSTSTWTILPSQQTAPYKGHLRKCAEGHLDLDDKDRLTKSQRQLFYLHITYKCRPSGLILECIDEAKGIYKRVGTATVFNQHGLYLESCFRKGDEIEEVILV